MSAQVTTTVFVWIDSEVPTTVSGSGPSEGQILALCKIAERVRNRLNGIYQTTKLSLKELDFPLCTVDGTTQDALQVVTDITQTCLLWGSSMSPISEADKNYFKAMYVLTSYVAGRKLPSANLNKLISTGKNALEIAKQIELADTTTAARQ